MPVCNSIAEGGEERRPKRMCIARGKGKTADKCDSILYAVLSFLSCIILLQNFMGAVVEVLYPIQDQYDSCLDGNECGMRIIYSQGLYMHCKNINVPL